MECPAWLGNVDLHSGDYSIQISVYSMKYLLVGQGSPKAVEMIQAIAMNHGFLQELLDQTL